MTEKTMIKAFIKAQTEMGKALKDAKNPHFKSKYADLKSVIAATLPALNANGFALMQIDGKDELGHYVQTVFAHESGESIDSKIYLVLEKSTMQGYGSAQTYARRYGCLGLAGIAPEDDDGNAASAPRKPNNPSSAGLSDARTDGVMDTLPDNATPREKAEAFANAIIADITKAKTSKGVTNAWGKWSKHIDALQGKHEDLYALVFGAWEEGMKE